MKKLTKISPILFACALVSCSDNSIITEPEKSADTQDNNYYITININLPEEEGTRATGDLEDKVDGTSNENKIDNATLFFIVGQKVITTMKATNGNFTVKDPEAGETGYTKKLQVLANINELAKLKESTVKLLFVANPEKINDPTVNANAASSDIEDGVFNVSNVNSDPIGDYDPENNKTEGKVLPLVNKGEYTIDFTGITGNDMEVLAKIRALFTGGTLTERIYELPNVLDLERAVARIDINDATPVVNTNHPADWTYQIGNQTDLRVKLYKMKVFNVNSKSYIFRHTLEGNEESANGLSKTPQIFEPAGVSNLWLVNPINTSFNNALSVSSEGEYSVENDNGKGEILITDLINRNPKDNYYPWCYVTENYISTSSGMQPANLPTNATGIAFTFQILGTDNEVLDQYLNNAPDCIKKEGTTGNDIRITMSSDGNKWQKVSYDATNGGYVLTYLGYITHAESGNLQYGVVRNTVYQIQLGEINRLPNPKEPESFALTLKVKVKPWDYTSYTDEW